MGKMTEQLIQAVEAILKRGNDVEILSLIHI